MPTLTYTLPYKINSPLVLSAQELDSIYLFGIDFRDSLGNRYSDENKEFHIKNAMDEIEGFLNIKLTPQIIEERLDFNLKDYGNWGYLRTTLPVEEAYELKGFLNSNRQVTYPAEWLSVRTTNDKDTGYFRQIRLVPGGSDSVDFSTSASYSTLYPFLAYTQSEIPNYFNVVYCTPTYDSIPPDIMSVVGKLAAISVMHVLGDNSPVGAGIASQSISIDSLSQNISTTASATSAVLSARILQYTKELKEGLAKLKDQYRGYAFASI
jgi:hypothetical protein